MSELTLHKLSYEILEQVSFKQGEVIFNSGEVLERTNYIRLQPNADLGDKKKQLNQSRSK